MKTIKDFNITGKRVLIRCDFNVPTDDYGNILDDFRIQKTLPTLQYAISQKAKIILMTHLGNPDGVVVNNLKLNQIRDRVEKLLGVTIMKAFDCIGRDVQNQASRLKKGEILLLENLRFYKGEKSGDVKFAQQLAKLGDIYVNDAFGDCHRQDASIAQMPQLLPSGAGLLLQSELENLDKVLKNPTHPLVVLVGGIKVETKVKFIENISKIADSVLIGGLIKKEIIGQKIKFTNPEKIIGPQSNLDALDIGEKTINMFEEKIIGAKTILWNGPFGEFENKKYKKGTLEIVKSMVESGAYLVAGGGQTIAFLRQEGMLDKFNHVSTGGGAMLSYLAGDILPGIKALNYNESKNKKS